MPETANLGLASTEELFRELICRFTLATLDDVGRFVGQERALVLAEMLGGLSPLVKEYRTVDA